MVFAWFFVSLVGENGVVNGDGVLGVVDGDNVVGVVFWSW